jgi:hypothetical protein
VIVINPGDGGVGMNLDHLAQPVQRADHKTRGFSFLFALCWMGFLVVAAGIKRHSWFLLGVGALGMLHNVLVAGVTRKPDAHGIPLEHLHGETIGKKSPGGTKRRKAMDVLAEAEKKIAGLGVALRPVFFSDIMLSTAERKIWTDAGARFQESIDKEETDRNATKENTGKQKATV